MVIFRSTNILVVPGDMCSPKKKKFLFGLYKIKSDTIFDNLCRFMNRSMVESCRYN